MFYAFFFFFGGGEHSVSVLLCLICLKDEASVVCCLKGELTEMQLYLVQPGFLGLVRAKEMQDLPVDQLRNLHKIRQYEVTLSSTQWDPWRGKEVSAEKS